MSQRQFNGYHVGRQRFTGPQQYMHFEYPDFAPGPSSRGPSTGYTTPERWTSTVPRYSARDALLDRDAYSDHRYGVYRSDVVNNDAAIDIDVGQRKHSSRAMPMYHRTSHDDHESRRRNIQPYLDHVPQHTENKDRRRHHWERDTSSFSHPPAQGSEPIRSAAKPKAFRQALPHRKATAEDARRAHVPAGYSYKNWNPDEEPIILLGSVFDACSLGRWIYDWTVHVYGATHPISDIAGDLWVLLIQLGGKIKRAGDSIQYIANEEHRELINDFIDAGERLWVRFKKILKICEEYMWTAMLNGNGSRKSRSVGRKSGVEFVESIFGRDRELGRTERLMSAIRLWSVRFDANCDGILRSVTR